MRQRDRGFAEALVEEIPLHANLDDAKVRAVERSYGAGFPAAKWKRKDALAKAALKLRNPDVLEAVRDVYVGSAGFSVVHAAQMHVAHIRGEAPPGASYQALKDYLGMTLPKAATKVDSRSVVVNVPVPPPPSGGDPPLMSARPVTRSVDFEDEVDGG